MPENTHELTDVLADGISVGAVAAYTFSNITANHTIVATFQHSGEGEPLPPKNYPRAHPGAT